MRTPDPEVGSRRATQTYGDATFDGTASPPLSEVPARVEEWDGERWVLVGHARSADELKRLFALRRTE